MRLGWTTRFALSLVVALAGSVAFVGIHPGAEAATYAPLDQPGPALSPTTADMDAALHCDSSTPLANATKDPVLLSPGTATDSNESFGWNWEPALNQLGIPWCGIDPPELALGPIDVAGEYIVRAIRRMHAMSGRKVDILGWSQGGMSMRWSLRFWPDTRALVDDVMGFAGSNHGTQRMTVDNCAQIGCRAAVYQQASDSEFIRALNSHTETFAGISYTNVYSRFDEVVIPDSDAAHCSSCLTVGPGMIANIQTQQVCPLDTSDHVLIGPAPATYAIIVDALTHDGPAVVSRIQANCASLFMPGVTDPAAASGSVAALQSAVGTLAIAPGPLPNPNVHAPVLHAEPALPCYVYATCASSGAPTPIPVTSSTPADHSDDDSDSSDSDDDSDDSDDDSDDDRKGRNRRVVLPLVVEGGR
ncbi:MAG TPA: hypothetical protein VMZ66_13310 [Aeromicrobium sp.]|nr:hypothetical protein [Aeromicrobium sp.]